MEKKENIKYMVRIANTDLEGNKSVYHALRKIKGVSFMFANLVCNLAGINEKRKIGELNEVEVKKLDEVIRNPSKFNAPDWILNRRKDRETGVSKHLLTSDLSFTKDLDIKHLKMIKAYRGMRHAYGLPVRGQRTRSNFRRNKGKAKLGVSRKKGVVAKK